MNLEELAKQLVEFKKALEEQTNDTSFVNAMCGQYLMNCIGIMMTTYGK